MKKVVKKYAKIYRNALVNNNFTDVETRIKSYE